MPVRNKRILALIGITTMICMVLIGVVSYRRQSTNPTAKGYCNDYGCTNFRNGTNWAIRNCQGTSTGDGSTYTCSQVGQTGSCGTQNYCCPGPGQLWTTDMTSCASVTPTSGCCACPTPTPIQVVSQCNGPCMTNANCATGSVCLFDQGYGWVCRNPACYKQTGCSCPVATATPTPTTTATPTPTSAQGQNTCGQSCNLSSDCRSDLRCIYYNNSKQCRNPVCSDQDDCYCN